MKLTRQSGVALVTAMIILLLVLTLVLGFTWLTLTDQQLGGVNAGVKNSFYGAEAGMEKLTADLGNLFATNAAPSGAQVNAIAQPSNEPNIPFINFLNPDNTPGYSITFPPDGNGNPLSQTHTIVSGNYQGMVGLLTPFTLTVTARSVGSGTGAEVRLTRQVQTVGIPIFQFGMFSQTDLSFFPGPNFNFGGRVHTNGNLWLAAGSTLTFADRVTAAREVIRTNLANGWPTSSGYTGTVNVPVAPGNFRPLGMDEGSILNGDPTAPLFNPSWGAISGSTYNHYIANYLTGVAPLNLSITLSGGAQPIDLVRRPVQGEDGAAPAKLAQRFYSEAGLRILLSDNPQDIMQLPCIDGTKNPVNLATVTTAQTNGVPIARSGSSAGAGGNYNPNDGYWTQGNPPATAQPLITGFLKIEMQNPYAVAPNPCGTWKDITLEILGLGIAGRNLNPGAAPVNGGPAPPQLPGLPGGYLGPSGCTDPSQNAIIRLERVRDNPSSATDGTGCGFDPPGTASTQPTDYWPNVLFDTREGTFRDVCPFGNCATTQVMLNGVMNYTELDISNLNQWIAGTIGVNGPNVADPTNSTYNYVVYFSDRRGNYTPAVVPVWPPASPSTRETGEYGFEDFINSGGANGCPDGALEAAEALDQVEDPNNQKPGGTLQTYGQNLSPLLPGLLNGVNGGALIPNPNCANPATLWPGWFANNGVEARENIPLFFRRALKIVNGSSVSLGTCPNGNPCGLTIVSENPVYVQGDFNALPNGNFGGAHGATAVIADALTLLSNNWNDINSFSSPYRLNFRPGATTTYRFAVISGKGISFPQPAGTSQDFGTDGGVHNFLRYLENWGGQTIFYRGSIASLYYNRQGTGIYKCCSTVYSPPTRGYNFDTEFLQPALLPPRTPLFRDVNTIGFTQTILPTP